MIIHIYIYIYREREMHTYSQTYMSREPIGSQRDRDPSPRAGVRFVAPRLGPVGVLLIGGNRTYLEKDSHRWVGSSDPIPITMYVTIKL